MICELVCGACVRQRSFNGWYEIQYKHKRYFVYSKCEEIVQRKCKRFEFDPKTIYNVRFGICIVVGTMYMKIFSYSHMYNGIYGEQTREIDFKWSTEQPNTSHTFSARIGIACTTPNKHTPTKLNQTNQQIKHIILIYAVVLCILNIKGCCFVYAQQYISTRDVAILFMVSQRRKPNIYTHKLSLSLPYIFAIASYIPYCALESN